MRSRYTRGRTSLSPDVDRGGKPIEKVYEDLHAAGIDPRPMIEALKALVRSKLGEPTTPRPKK